MENNKNSRLFREKSMDQLTAPDQLTGYLRVTGPGIWFVLVGLIVLLGGFLVWGIFGRIISTVTAPSKVTDGIVSCFVRAEEVDLSDELIELTVGDVKMEAKTEDVRIITLDASDDPFLYKTGYLSPGKKVAVLTCATDLKDGDYDTVVTAERLKPISLLFSKNEGA